MQKSKKNGTESTPRPTSPLQTGPEYQVGALTAIFVVMLLLKYSFFGYNDFQLAFLSIGLIAAVILCGNVRLKLTCSRSELLVAFGLFSSVVVILFLIGYEAGFTPQGLQSQYDFLDNVVGAPVSEEAFYRLFLLNLFVGLTGRRFLGLIVTSILFDLNHISVKYAQYPIAIVPVMIVMIAPALILGLVFLYSQNLGPAIATHSALNLGISIMSLPLEYYVVLPILILFIAIPAIHYILSKQNIKGTILSRAWHFGIEQDQGIMGLGIALLIFLTFGSYLFLLQFYIHPTGTMLLYQLDIGLLLLVALYISIGVALLTVDAVYRKIHHE